MTDDGHTVRLTQQEYDALTGRLMRLFIVGGITWDFPWKGPRCVYVATEVWIDRTHAETVGG